MPDVTDSHANTINHNDPQSATPNPRHNNTIYNNHNHINNTDYHRRQQLFDLWTGHDAFVPSGIYRIPSMITTNNGTICAFAQARARKPP